MPQMANWRAEAKLDGCAGPFTQAAARPTGQGCYGGLKHDVMNSGGIAITEHNLRTFVD